MSSLALRSPALALALTLGGLLLCGPVQAQQANSANDMVGRMQYRISELERLVQDLTGKVEQSLYENRQLQTKLENAQSDIDFRLNALESAGPAAAAPANSVPSSARPTASAGAGKQGTPAPAEGVLGFPGKTAPAQGAASAARPAAAGALPAGSENDQYNYAFSLLRNADYPAAEQAFKAFLDQHPKGSLAGNAQYWLGETYYVRGDYEQAAVAFMGGYQSHPDSSKGPDNLLKLGLAMANLGKSKEACAAFGRLESQYPKAADAIKRRAKEGMSKLGC
ncbi:tol-pal system protein YbgF [Rhodospirillum rubrum]|uniref:Cell division coordinator CpoB n=1 Tax=Rhodospirillum rubrum (strain ATCC 11170 / ATH 1.1.1 / DSM 467 / LMG 4362 / NCIMB 8255 / S1) TaxID=269796 RepID=Q2RVE8_RHORT|nr:tol-pal system protein YbgF [Rhodospirillum rubrum]ABC21897.1 conserved hypothetical protein [Rhodospirillum rubrum ATCC 11170]AEO47599.1 hypothetical protein F11_05645 [Rhodospirillum rubrum F11]MBK5953460.1 tol-pal system protein YbgF [Rhodospirillum rubrum]QXG81556.1 tol-pal system protein YbgF [Rhodospirillum rubrum]HAQ01142.1 tol-pal system protein YbgF [Rhodospirillum rubrum]